MKIQRILALGLMTVFASAATAQEIPDTDIKAKEHRTAQASGQQGEKITNEEFAKKAGASGAAEVAMGKLGAQKATDPDVKAYAQQMVKDHTTANKELMAAAKTKGLEVPSSPDLMHKGMMEKFEAQAADKDFDHDFMQQMVRDHKMVVELYQNASKASGLDPALQAHAKKTLPIVQQHLKDAQKLEAKLGK